MKVLKFGGTSMGDEQTWQQVLQIIQRYPQPFVIVSATARTTRQLLAAAEQALNKINSAHKQAEKIHTHHVEIINNFLNNYPNAKPVIAKKCKSWIDKKIAELDNLLHDINKTQTLTLRQKDAIASIGEHLSSYLLAQCGSAAGLQTTWIDAAKIIRTDSDFGQASPDKEIINKKAGSVFDNLGNGTIPIMGGYYGKDKQGNITTLGFEGSDYSASLVGAALSADAIEIWTDVSGIYTCDPRVIDGARPIPQLSFQEATELAYFGAKVLHPSTTKPASQKQIPVRVKNIFDPEAPGTEITHQTVPNGNVKAITYKKDCSIITVTSSQTVMGYEFLSGVFDTLRLQHLPVDVVTTTEASVSIAIEHKNGLEQTVEQLKSLGDVKVETQNGIISLVGCRKDYSQSFIKNILAHLNNRPIKLFSYSRSKGNLNIVMHQDDIIPSVKLIHDHLFG